MVLIAIFIAVLLDWIIGDPYSWPHPVKVMGKYINTWLLFQKKWRLPPYLSGFLLWLSLIVITGGMTQFFLWGVSLVSPIFYWLVWIYLAYSTLAARSLAVEAKKVYKKLMEESIENARKQVGMIVGRDTSHLNEEEIVKATVETVAENISDGVVAPLLCLFLGGPVLAMVYKAVNTLDSMIGYKTEKYLQIGFVSAKMDDLFNLIPARITWVFLLLVTQILQFDIKEAMKIGWRDRYRHASPNSAFSESVVAGALGIQLGGSHIYHGEMIEKPTIGERKNLVEADLILSSIEILFLTTTVALIVFSIFFIAIFNF